MEKQSSVCNHLTERSFTFQPLSTLTTLTQGQLFLHSGKVFGEHSVLNLITVCMAA